MTKSCHHFELACNDELLQSYKNLLQHTMHTAQVQMQCHVCKIQEQLVACLQCIHVACRADHSSEHCRVKNHPLQVSTLTGLIWCVECQQFVHDCRLVNIRAHHEHIKNAQLTATKSHAAYPLTQGALEHAPNKVAGLLNLGATCFMSVILQSLMHNPMVSRYLMADRHPQCFNKSQCTVCQLIELHQQTMVQQVCAPTSVLYTTWRDRSNAMIGFAQQDAHEFFIAYLDLLHRDMLSAERSRKIDSSHINKVFSGRFQSDVVCVGCGACSSVADPFLDISLDVRPVFSPIFHQANASVESLDVDMSDATPEPMLPVVEKSPRTKSKMPPSGKNLSPSKLSMIKTAGLVETHTLYECLDRFTSAEKLSPQDYKCAKCTQQQGATKQLSFKQLPLTLAIHLKMYNTSGGANNAVKINNMIVQFPSVLDMSAYTAKKDKSPQEEYTLFSVLVHSGSLHSGHYTVYVRTLSSPTEQWYEMDDGLVTAVQWEQVSKCQAYMLFYARNYYQYK